MLEPDRENGLTSASLRFPSRAGQIRLMMDSNDDFRSLCDDLAAAERAMRSADRLPPSVCDLRREEFSQLADSLAEEIERCLDEMKVVPLIRRPNGKI